jgi:hypothetical protein
VLARATLLLNKRHKSWGGKEDVNRMMKEAPGLKREDNNSKVYQKVFTTMSTSARCPLTYNSNTTPLFSAKRHVASADSTTVITASATTSGPSTMKASG